ncbi:MAG TPA: hypothetical protein VHP30_16545 [Ignavibacteriales bacterium]|nr:hypothetical protein [Ignavibacteriales bacterium]
MRINGIEAQYQNYVTYGCPATKNDSNAITPDSFQKEIENWEKRIIEAKEKERENDKNGSIQMSEKQWRNLMKKVDNAIHKTNDKLEDQKQEESNNITNKTVPSND